MDSTGPDLTALLTSVERDGARLAATPVAALGTPVPSCPGWDLAQLLGHTGWVHRWVTATLLADPLDPPSPRTIEKAPAGEAVIAWYADAVQAMLDAFGRTDLDQTFKTFVGPQPGRWWARRMAHETSIHRWDAQHATGTVDPIDAALAVDGIDEAFDTYLRHRFDGAAFGSNGQTLHLHATDIEGEWMLTMAADGVQIAHGHGKGDVAVRGTAEDLLLFVMSRRPATALELFGDSDLAARWQAAANF